MCCLIYAVALCSECNASATALSTLDIQPGPCICRVLKTAWTGLRAEQGYPVRPGFPHAADKFQVTESLYQVFVYCWSIKGGECRPFWAQPLRGRAYPWFNHSSDRSRSTGTLLFLCSCSSTMLVLLLIHHAQGASVCAWEEPRHKQYGEQQGQQLAHRTCSCCQKASM